MNRASQRRETVWVFAMNAVQIAASALAFIRLARQLGPTEYGEFAFAVAVASFLPLLAGIGGDHVLIMQASRGEGALSALLGNAFVLRLVTSALVYGGVLLTVRRFTSSSPVVLELISAAALVTAFAQPLLASYYRVIGRPRFVWAALAAGQILFCGLLYLPRVAVTLHYAAGAYLATSVAVVGLALADAMRRIRPTYDGALLKANMRLGVFFSTSQLVDLAFQRTDVLLLQALSGAAAVGMYTAGYKFVSLFLVIPSTLHVVYLPDFHRLAGTGDEEWESLRNVFLGMRRVLVEISAGALGAVAVSARRIIEVFLNRQYAAASDIIILGAAGIFLTFATYPYYMLAEAINKVEPRFWLRCIATLLLAMITSLLILWRGIDGAAAGLVVGSGIFLTMLHQLTRPVNGGVKALVKDLRPLIAALTAGLLVWSTDRMYGSGFVGLILCAATFVVAFVGIGSAFGLLYNLNLKALYRFAKK